LEKRKVSEKFPIVLRRIEEEKFKITPLDLEVVKKCSKIKIFEMHDRIIVATAKIMGLPIVTKDPEIQTAYKKIIW